MPEPIILSAATVFSAIGTTFKLAEFCLALKEVSTESGIFLTLIQRVRKDLNEALRERHEKSEILQTLPGKKAWIDEAIIDVKKSLNDIGLLIENARIDVDKGKNVTLVHRFEWVLSNHNKFVMREMALKTCHASLLGAISAMHTMGVGSGMLSPTLPCQTASWMPVSPSASSSTLVAEDTFAAPSDYAPISASELAALHDPRMLKSPSRRRPKVSKSISTPANEPPGVGLQPILRHQRSDLSIGESLFRVNGSSGTSIAHGTYLFSYLVEADMSVEQENRSRAQTLGNSPQLPPLDFSTIDENLSPPTSTKPPHSRSHSYSVPNITFHHHDSVSSISSDGGRPSFPYFDPSFPTDVLELEGTSSPSNVPNSDNGGVPELSHTYTSSQIGTSVGQYPQSPPSYTIEPASPLYSEREMMETAAAAMRSQSEGSFGTSVLAESLRSSTVQERRRRARARFERQ